VTVPLAGYVLQPSDVTAPQSLPIQVDVDVASSGSNMVVVQEGQSFEANATLSSLAFDHVTWYFSSTGATIDSIVQNIEIPKGFDSIQLASAVLTLDIENGVGLPGSIDIQMDGNNGQTLPVTGAVAPRTLATAATTSIVQPNVAQFFSPIPSQVVITGSATFGDGQLGTIRAGDFITGQVHVESPLEMVIKETPIETDVENQEVDQSNIDAITNHVLEARFVYNIVNHLPIGATINILISPDSATLFTNPRLRFDSITVNAAPVTSGIVTDTLSTGFQTIAVDSADVQILKNSRLYVAQELILHGSNGQAVKLTKSDYLSISGRIEVEYHFDGKF
jgi:hypothetical protein